MIDDKLLLTVLCNMDGDTTFKIPDFSYASLGLFSEEEKNEAKKLIDYVLVYNKEDEIGDLKTKIQIYEDGFKSLHNIFKDADKYLGYSVNLAAEEISGIINFMEDLERGDENDFHE